MSRSKLKKNYTGIQKKSVTIKTSKEKAWRKISDINRLESWAQDVKKTQSISKTKRGIGAIRKVFLEDSVIEEHIVDWKSSEYFSYIATSGLPLRAYFATLSIKPRGRNSITITWKSYFNSNPMTRNDFLDFCSELGSFYFNSLRNLKRILEN